ncbi:hypothetical protein WA026_016990 [Henosepilachna vigintioctopunctata]|uniref:non-specific serine/threonine protein kinase n=1 Tax=Henosepilachna vigintioctopunctata TaxID=420089 RepID=A0AAW1U9B5_9CUCU
MSISSNFLNRAIYAYTKGLLSEYYHSRIDERDSPAVLVLCGSAAGPKFRLPLYTVRQGGSARTITTTGKRRWKHPLKWSGTFKRNFRMLALGIIYRDIKLENILVDAKGHIVLTDFGLSKELPREGPEEELRAYSFCGTIEYMAPEVVKGGTQGHDIAVDWWSIGVLTYELLTGASPFTVEGERNNQQEISKRILRTTPPIPECLSEEVADFITKLLVKDPRQRLGGGEGDAEELKRHPFFKNLDWNKLYRKEIPAPFKPRIRNELDVSNFSEEFTQMPPTDSPCIVIPDQERFFRGYSFVAPSVQITGNDISEAILNPIREHDSSELLNSELQNSPFFQNYELDINDDILGDGTFSECRRCIQKSTGKEFAVKIIKRQKDCTQEVNLLRACQGHTNIVNLHEFVQDDRFNYLVLEYLKGGELFERIRKNSHFNEAQAASIMRRLVSAVSFMHTRGVVHRDLKPENLVFTSLEEDSEIKVIDFGFARLKDEKDPLHTPCFTLGCAAPEVLKGTSEGYDENCDLWSLGVILYTMLCGRAPFHARSRDEKVTDIMARIKRGDFNFEAPAWDGVSEEAKSIVRGLLTVDPSQRLKMPDLLSNSWITDNQNVPQIPLMTPDILSASAQAERTVTDTLNAFHQAEREGFRLQDVLNAKLAQRRRLKKSSSEKDSTSPCTSFTSDGSLMSNKTSLEIKTEEIIVDPEIVVKTEAELSRNSTSSSGIVVSDKGSIDAVPTSTRRKQKPVCEPTRRSERIRNRQRNTRMEIDLDSLPLPWKRKRKLSDISEDVAAGSPSLKKTKTVLQAARKVTKANINR